MNLLFKMCPFLLFILFVPAILSEASTPYKDLPSAGLPVLDESSGYGYSRSYGTLPASYDSRKAGYITAVKDQNPWGTCWTFGALSAGEASLIKKGLTDNQIDLSELHLSYFFFNSDNDPLGNTSGDTVAYPNTGESYLESGGNNLFTMFALSKWLGPVDESAVPYSLAEDTIPVLDPALAYTETVHLQNARFTKSSDLIGVKKLIMEYGAVSTAIYFDPRYLSDSFGYYCPLTANANNHIISIVGWDDNYPTSSFSGIQPSHSGAWIAKNSYGTAFGDDGYFYISYEDMTLCTHSDALSYAFDLEPADNYDHNYQYDGSFGASILRGDDGSAFSNVYTISGNPGGREKLEAISFSLYTPNVSYRIQIYKNPDPGSPESGTPMLKNPQTGTTTYSGYYTIPLATQPVFEQGETFSVVLTFDAQNADSTFVFVDHSNTTAGIQFTSKVSSYQSFYRINDSWQDMAEKNAVVRIKAFTTDTTEAATSTNGKPSKNRYMETPVITEAVASSYNSIRLTWKPVANARYYKIYRSTSPNGIFVRIKTTTKCTFNDTNKRCGTTYYYRIRSCKNSKYSSYSKVVKVKAAPAQTTIQKLSRTDSDRNIQISWKQVKGADGYLVFRSTRKNGSYKKVKTLKSGTTLSSTLTLPSYNKRYYFRIKAYRIVNGKRIIGKASLPKSIKISS